MRYILWPLLAAAIIVSVLASFKGDALPERSGILAPLYQEPQQGPTDLAPFATVHDGIEYAVTPRFTYRIRGLVVAQHDSRSWFDLSHRDARDFFNLKDIAVIWGENLSVADYRQVRYSHTDFTVEYAYDREVGFRAEAISNNHLLAATTAVAEQIMRARVGDQVDMQGYLVDYGRADGSFLRRTSTVRTDSKNGACEIIYVTGFTILQEANPGWRQAGRYARRAAAYTFLALLFGTLLRIWWELHKLRRQARVRYRE